MSDADPVKGWMVIAGSATFFAVSMTETES